MAHSNSTFGWCGSHPAEDTQGTGQDLGVLYLVVSKLPASTPTSSEAQISLRLNLGCGIRGRSLASLCRNIHDGQMGTTALSYRVVTIIGDNTC